MARMKMSVNILLRDEQERKEEKESNQATLLIGHVYHTQQITLSPESPWMERNQANTELTKNRIKA